MESKFGDKISRGETPTAEDWSIYLIEAHKQAPSMTPKAFAAHKTKTGLNSYQRLANTIETGDPRDLCVVDLACGDGHLIPYLLPKIDAGSTVFGIDMSEGELAVARQAVKDNRVKFLTAYAQELPLESGSVDYVFCHMALMLMMPVEPVVAELSRVLKLGGVFSAVIGARNTEGLFSEIQSLIGRYLLSKYPTMKHVRTGDPRVGSLEGLRGLFDSRLGFNEIADLEDVELEVRLPVAELWSFIQDMYLVSMLAQPEQEELRAMVLALAQPHADPNGEVSFPFAMKLFTASTSVAPQSKE
jgi:SAM-dependent methyltransferase